MSTEVLNLRLRPITIVCELIVLKLSSITKDNYVNCNCNFLQTIYNDYLKKITKWQNSLP